MTEDDPRPSPRRSIDRLRRLPLVGSPALADRDYRRLWAGVACNAFGRNGEQVILGLLVFEITRSTAWVGVALALYFLPFAVLGVFTGAVADWLDRRLLLRRIELCLVVNLAGFAALAAADLLALWLVLAFTLVSGSLRAMHGPVRSSYAYDIVGGRQVIAGLGLLNAGARLGQLIGALLAGAVLQRLGTPAAVLALALVHVMAFAAFAGLRSAGHAAPAARVPIGQNLREYWAEARGNRVLLMLVVLTASVEIFGFSFSTTLPELAAGRFDLGAEGLGVMHATRAAGGLVASLALVVLPAPTRPGAVYLMVIYGFGASLLLLAAFDHFGLALAALMLVAGLASASDILTQSLMQLSVPNHLRGRAMGAWLLAIGAAPLGHLEMGALAVSLGVGPALAANGLALVGVAVLATIAVPRLRRL